MKTDQPKTAPIPTLRTVTANTTPRFMQTTVSQNMNAIPLTIQNSGGKPITIPSSSVPSGHKSDVTIAVLPMTNRIIPASGAPTSGYHIPRGPAAVANISIPRGSAVTPIRNMVTSGNPTFSVGAPIRASSGNPVFSIANPIRSVNPPSSGNPSYSVANPIRSNAGNLPSTVNPAGNPGFPVAAPVRSVASSGASGSSFMPVPGLSVLRSHWIVTTSGATPTSNVRPITSHLPVRHASMAVATKVATGPRMHIDQQNPRPQTVLLQKQIITGPTTSQMVRMSDGNQGFIKTTLPLRSPSPRIISTTQGGAKLPMFPILVPSNTPLLKANPQTPLGTKVMVSQAGHGSPIQISSMPNPTTIKTTGAFQTSSNNPMSTTSTLVTSVKPSGHPVIVTSTPVSNLNKYSPNIVNTSSTSSFTPGSNTPAYYYEQNPPTSNPSYPIGTITGPTSAQLSQSQVGAAQVPLGIAHGPSQGNMGPTQVGATQHMSVRLGSNFTPLPHSRPGLHPQPSAILTVPRGMATSQFSLPGSRVVGSQPSVLVSSRPQLITSTMQSNIGSTAVVTTGHIGPRFSQVSTLSSTPMPMPLIHESSAKMMSIPVSSEGSGDESSHAQSNMTTSNVKLNASPRPSILRKRDLDASTPLKGPKNLTPLLNAPMAVSSSMNSSGISSSISNFNNTINSVSCNITNTINAVSTLPPSPSSPPKRPDSGSGSSSQSSSSSVSSSNGGGAPPTESMEVVPPPEETPLGANTSQLISGLSLSNCPVEMSPRKKPRKQLLTGDLQERKMEVEDMEFITEEKIKSEQHHDDNSGSDNNMLSSLSGHYNSAIPAEPPPPPSKKPHVSLLNSYRQGWKSRHHHFMRYSDVKAKDERRPSLSDIASQKQILQKVNGWKIYHLRTQMENMATLEKEHSSKLSTLLETFEKNFDSSDREVNRVNELIKGNIQRNNVVQDQLIEAHDHLMKIFEHKNTVTDLITKNGNRRTIKKKDKY